MIEFALRVVVVALAGIVIGLIAWAAGGGSTAVAISLLLLALAGHSIVMLAEFTLMRVINRRAGEVLPPWPSWWRAWARECLYAALVFCWRQPWRRARWPDTDRAAGGSARRGVVLVHGFACNRGVWNPWLARLAERGVPTVAVDLEPPWGQLDDYAPQIEQAVARLERATGAAPVMVAHSMGGLAARGWLAQPGRDQRVHHLITLGSPHHGTWLARWGLGRNVRQMRLGSAWLRQRLAAEPAALRRRMTCFAGGCDNIVFPHSSAWLDGADQRLIPNAAHLDLVACPEPFEELLRRLAE